jgi:hypothetical protein
MILGAGAVALGLGALWVMERVGRWAGVAAIVESAAALKCGCKGVLMEALCTAGDVVGTSIRCVSTARAAPCIAGGSTVAASQISIPSFDFASGGAALGRPSTAAEMLLPGRLSAHLQCLQAEASRLFQCWRSRSVPSNSKGGHSVSGLANEATV